MCERGESWKCAFWGTRTRNPKAKGRDIALRCPRCALHCVWRCKCHRGFDALPRSFRPLLRGRGHRSAMSLPANGIFGLRAAPGLAVQCHEGFDALPRSFRPLLRGRGHRSAMSLPEACVRNLVSYSGVVKVPRRATLPHAVPFWIDPTREIYFITVNCAERWTNQLTLPRVSNALFETVRHRQEKFLWWPYLFLLMPDHLHALLSFPPSGKPIQQVVSKWKEWTAKEIGIVWQRDFFEHRLRQEESRRQKADYILENPVRRQLIARAEDWPFVYFADGQRPGFER